MTIPHLPYFSQSAFIVDGSGCRTEADDGALNDSVAQRELLEGANSSHHTIELSIEDRIQSSNITRCRSRRRKNHSSYENVYNMPPMPSFRFPRCRLPKRALRFFESIS